MESTNSLTVYQTNREENGLSTTLDAEISRCDLTWGKGPSNVPFTPVEGVDIHPIIFIRDGKNKVFDDDEHTNVENPIGRTVGIKYRWYRGPARNVCCYHPQKPASLQCTITQRCFCSPECFSRSFQAVRENLTTGAMIPRCVASNAVGCAPAAPFHLSSLPEGEDWEDAILRTKGADVDCVFDRNHFLAQHDCTSNANSNSNSQDQNDNYNNNSCNNMSSGYHMFGKVGTQHSCSGLWVSGLSGSCVLSESDVLGPEWIQVGCGREYTPTPADLGHIIMFEASLYPMNNSESSKNSNNNENSEENTKANVTPTITTATGIKKTSVPVGYTQVRVRTACVVPQLSPVPVRNIVRISGAGANAGPPKPIFGLPPNMNMMGTNSINAAGGAVSRFPSNSPAVDPSQVNSSISVGITAPPPLPGEFRVISWNVLADIYATTEAFPYAEPFALSWAYRRQRILSELFAYNADIICLQEVQAEHYEEYFLPQFRAAGYAGVYKAKTSEIFTAGAGKRRSGKMTIDGCATFYRTNLFSLSHTVPVEFYQHMREWAPAFLSDVSVNHTEIKRLLKDNVALIVVLTELTTNDPVADSNSHCANRRAAATGRQLIVVNTHIAANPEHTDIKLWQSHVLLNATQRVLTECSANVRNSNAQPGVVIVGDFNSPPNSAVYSLLASGRVPTNHPDLRAANQRRLMQTLKDQVSAGMLSHRLPIRSAYSRAGFERASSAARAAIQASLSMLPMHDTGATAAFSAAYEPEFTNLTGAFSGCLDYLWFNETALEIAAVLDHVDEALLRSEMKGLYLQHHALPTPVRPSDHVVMLTDFAWTSTTGNTNIPNPNPMVNNAHLQQQQQQQNNAMFGRSRPGAQPPNASSNSQLIGRHPPPQLLRTGNDSNMNVGNSSNNNNSGWWGGGR